METVGDKWRRRQVEVETGGDRWRWSAASQLSEDLQILSSSRNLTPSIDDSKRILALNQVHVIRGGAGHGSVVQHKAPPYSTNISRDVTMKPSLKLSPHSCSWTLKDEPTAEGSVPHPLGDDSAWRPAAVHGLIQSVSVEHQTIVKTSGDDVHLENKQN